MNSNERTHIIKRRTGWAIKKEGSLRATKIYDTKEIAIKNAQSERQAGRDVVIHKEDGSIQKWEKALK